VTYLAARLPRPDSGTVTQRIATTASYYRRTRLVSFNVAGAKGQESAVIETRAVATGAAPSAAPNTLAEASDGTDHLDVSWVNGDGDAATRIYVDGTVIHTAAKTVTTYTIAGLSPGTTYQVDADHWLNGQASAKVGVVAMATASATLDAPTSFAAHGLYGGPPHLYAAWVMGANAEGAQTVIEESANGTFSDAAVVTDASPTPPGATSASSALHASGTYTFRAYHTRTGSTNSTYSDTDPATYGSDDV